MATAVAHEPELDTPSIRNGSIFRHLPAETLDMITSYLRTKNTLAWSTTCHSIRNALKPIFLEHIYFPDLLGRTALSCLATFDSQDLTFVKKITFTLNERTASLSKSELLEAVRAWEHVLNCLSSLEVVEVDIKWTPQSPRNVLLGLSDVSLWSFLARLFAARLARIRTFEIGISTVEESGMTHPMGHEEFNTILDCIEKLPARVNLRLGANESFSGAGQEELHVTVQRLTRLGVNVEMRTLRRPGFRSPILGRHLAASLRHLQLQQLELDIQAVRSALLAGQETLNTASFWLKSTPQIDPVTQDIHMSCLKQLTITIPPASNETIDDWILHIDQTTSQLFKHLQTPALEELEMGDTRVSKLLHTSKVLRKFIGNARRLRIVRSHWYQGLDTRAVRERHFESWGALQELFSEGGVQLLHSIRELRYRHQPTESSQFDTAIPWSPDLRRNLSRLHLVVSKSLPWDLYTVGDMTFENLEVLSIRLAQANPVHAFVNVFNRFRLPKCRLLRISIRGVQCDALLWSIVSLIPYMRALEEVRINLSGSIFQDTVKSVLMEQCSKRDIGLDFAGT